MTNNQALNDRMRNWRGRSKLALLILGVATAIGTACQTPTRQGVALPNSVRHANSDTEAILDAQIDPRTSTPIRVAASGIGHSYYADRAQGLRYYREAYSAECFNLQGTTLCIAGVQDGPEEEPFFPNPEWTWS